MLTSGSGRPGVSYVAGPLGATAVSFQLIDGSVTERVTTLDDEEAAREHLRTPVTGVRTCPVDPDVNVELATIGLGVGDEYVQAVVTRNYQSGRAPRRSRWPAWPLEVTWIRSTP